MLDIAQIFHTGLVTPDIDAAIEQYSDVFATPWTSVEVRDLSLRGPAGPFQVSLRIAYTCEGPHRLELIEAVPGTIWTPATNQRLGTITAHHLGIWSENVPEQSMALEAAGCPLLATMVDDPDKATYFAYHRMPDGSLIELVDVASKPDFERWWSGEPLAQPPQS